MKVVYVRPSPAVLLLAEEVRCDAVERAEAEGGLLAWAAAPWAGTISRAFFLVSRCTFFELGGERHLYFDSVEDVEESQHEDAVRDAFAALTRYLED